jgi:hypothetical protein
MLNKRQQARGVPGGAGGQLVPFDQHGVPAGFRQVVGDPGADCAAADDEGFDVGFHGTDSRIWFAPICQSGGKPGKSTRPLASENDMLSVLNRSHVA